MISKKLLRASALACLGAALWAGTPGCGPSIGAYCEKICDCTGCNDSELDECVDAVDDAKRQAENDGCSSEFDAALSCLDDELVCDDGDTSSDGCESEADALAKCSSGIISGGRNACEAYADALIAKLEECGQDVPDTGDGEGAECTDAAATLSACLQTCVPAYDCDCVQDPSGDGCSDKLQEYSDCTSACL